MGNDFNRVDGERRRGSFERGLRPRSGGFFEEVPGAASEAQAGQFVSLDGLVEVPAKGAGRHVESTARFRRSKTFFEGSF